MNRNILLQTPHGSLHGHLELPEFPRGLVLFASSHQAAVDPKICEIFVLRGYATLAIGLLSSQEIQFVDATQNVPRLALRLIDILDLIRHDGDMQELPLALFVAGDIAPAAIRAAARRDTQVKALACHGGLIDRAGAEALDLLVAPLLMLFDATDAIGQTAYQRAIKHLGGIHQMNILEAGDEPGEAATIWFSQHLAGRPQDPAGIGGEPGNPPFRN